MSDTLPMFPLGTVLFPGVSVPLHVFEDRYRAMVHHLLRIPDPVDRVFGSVAIREGYEIGEHGNQSLYRVGCRIRMTEVESHPDGTFDLVGVGIDRIALDRLDTRGPYPVGHVTARPDAADPVPEDVVERARVMFTAYRSALAQVRGDLLPAELPQDPTYLSWTLAALTPLPMPDRQSLLEAEDAGARLLLATDLLRAELRAMNVIPSLPATELARTRWSPN